MQCKHKKIYDRLKTYSLVASKLVSFKVGDIELVMSVCSNEEDMSRSLNNSVSNCFVFMD